MEDIRDTGRHLTESVPFDLTGTDKPGIGRIDLTVTASTNGDLHAGHCRMNQLTEHIWMWYLRRAM